MACCRAERGHERHRSGTTLRRIRARCWIDGHKCAAPSCTRVIGPRRLMCARHWSRVPRALQCRVYRCLDGAANQAVAARAASRHRLARQAGRAVRGGACLTHLADDAPTASCTSYTSPSHTSRRVARCAVRRAAAARLDAGRRVQHYLGYAKSLTKRLERHRAGDGAQLLRVAIAAGIDFECVRTWPGNRALEKRLKSLRSHRHLCPRCVGADVAARRGRCAMQASA
jgi:hypothetical protein